MKKIKFENKLSLKKETITRLNEARLNEDQMDNLKGGARTTVVRCRPTILQTYCNGHSCA